jgi:3-oxoacyl-[acyl-carrier protein] reductase
MYNGKVVLITGTSRGVGKSLSCYFKDNGAEVLNVSRTSPSGLGFNLKAWYYCDLSNINDVFATMKSIQMEYKKIDIVINNAAVMSSRMSQKMPIEDAINMVNVDLLAPFLVCREASRLMYDIPYGRIINIGSIADVCEAMGDSVYAACKAGLKTMTNILAKEYARQNITCNTLAISAIDTDMLAQHKPETVDALVKTFPIPRKATIDDITNVIDFFCSEKSGYVTAQTIYLGGLHK